MAKSTNYSESTPSFNLIDTSTQIRGDIKCNDIRIDGLLIGNVKCNGKIILGESGKIEGSIICKNADLSGSIKGNVTTNELTYLKSTAVFNGELTTNKLSIEIGATFNGTCKMGGIQNGEKEQNIDKTDIGKTI